MRYLEGAEHSAWKVLNTVPGRQVAGTQQDLVGFIIVSQLSPPRAGSLLLISVKGTIC